MSQLFFDGYCPQCVHSGPVVHLSINAGDLYECPDCHLMIGLAPLRAVVIRRRGNGNFRDLANRRYSSVNLTGLLLVPERADAHYEPDKFNHFPDREALEAYLATITAPDPHC